jgi:hypothetical protein
MIREVLLKVCRASLHAPFWGWGARSTTATTPLKVIRRIYTFRVKPL